MRRLMRVLALALLAVAASASSAMADERSAPMSMETSRFELFGTSFCTLDAASATSTPCDVTISEKLLKYTPARPETGGRLVLGGVSVCSVYEYSPLGSKCDVLWELPPPAAAWRDQPEIKMADWVPNLLKY